MRELDIDILSGNILKKFDAICFTSNGIVKGNGELVMGAGVALSFKNKFTDISFCAGRAVKTKGNICQVVTEENILLNEPISGIDDSIFYNKIYIISFPTKHHFKDKSDIKLIEKSAKELMRLINAYNWRNVALPRPGCRNGNLDWNYVKQIVGNIFDERVVVCNNEDEKRLNKMYTKGQWKPQDILNGS